MPAIPEFVLRKLYVPGSLKACENGFELQLKNTLAPVTLTGLAITADGHSCEPEEILLRLPATDEMTAAAITGEQPFSMTVNSLLGVRVKASMPRKRLVIHVNTREAGTLQFSIPVRNAEPGVGARQNLGERIRRSVQSSLRAWLTRQDPQHPSFHFTPPANWMNDPNGLIYWKGTYHLFYQYNPFEASWGNIHWGHAISQDMLHWKHQPIALAPDPSGVDAGGCFSGCAVDDGAVTLIYTGVFPEMQCMARSSADDLVAWKKHPLPLISAPPQGMNVVGFRDPCVWKEDREWRMAVGSGIHDEGGAVLLYGSPNLTDWQYIGILYQKDSTALERVETGTMWECPCFFPLREKWVLILSVCDARGPIGTIFYIGNYHQNRFIPSWPARWLDHGAGGCFYAPQTFLSENGERVMFGWLREARGVEEMKRASWSGAMSLPRVLSLKGDDLVCMPLAATAKLRGKAEILEKSGQVSTKVSGARMEIVACTRQNAEQWSGVHLMTGKASHEGILIGWDHIKHEVVVDCRKAGGLLSSLPIEEPALDELKLHIFLDGSVLEVFVEDRQCITARFYVRTPRTLRVQLLGEGSAEVWTIESGIFS